MGEPGDVRNVVTAEAVTTLVQAGTIGSLVMSGGPARDDSPVARQLPAVVGDFTGRARELARLDDLVPAGQGSDPRHVQVVVDGAAGAGKTTFAVWWAHRVEQRFPHGTLFVDLRGHSSGEPLSAGPVLAGFLRSLGIGPERIPDDLDAQAALYRSVLSGRRVLVVLDNAAAPGQVRPLLPAAPGCMALITSRATLTGLAVTQSVHRITLDLFSAAEATTLVHQIIGEGRAAAQPHAVAALVAVSTGLPLAIRVAATRVGSRPSIPVDALVADIAEGGRLDALSGSGDEHSDVRTVFDWSYHRLPVRQALVFRRLGLHTVPEIGVEVAAALTELDPATAYRHLDALADLHLVEPAGHRRFRVHDLLHSYAKDRITHEDTAEERRAAIVAMLGWYASAAVEADRLVFPGNSSLQLGDLPPVPVPFQDRGQAMTWLNAERDTLSAALDQAAGHGLHRVTMRIAAAMRFLALEPRTWWTARLEAESRGIEAARSENEEAISVVFLLRRGDTLQQMGRWTESDTDHRAALETAQGLGNSALCGEALIGLGRNEILQGRFADAERHYRDALPLVRGVRDGYVEAVVECNLSSICAALGRYEEALAHAEQELSLRVAIGAPDGVAFARRGVAVARQGLGEHTAAIELCEQALATYRTVRGTQRYQVEAWKTMAISLCKLGDDAGAVRCLTEAVSLLDFLHDPEADVLRARLNRMRGNRAGVRRGHVRRCAGP